MRGLRILGGVLLIALTGACFNQSNTRREAVQLTGGDPDRGVKAIGRYGCASCHTIPGIRGADSLVGPPLTRIAQRTYLAGILQNTPENLVKWIYDPPAIDPQTAMPNVHLSETDAKDIASYLYTIR